jgi:membrane dipeptidase
MTHRLLVALFALTLAGACTPKQDDPNDKKAQRTAALEKNATSDAKGKAMVAAARPEPTLSPEDAKKKAEAIAQKVIITDGHIDVPYRLHKHLDDKGQPKEDVGERTDKGDFDYPRARAGGLDAPFMSIYTPASHEKYPAKGKPTWDGSRALADELIDLVEGIEKKHPDKFVIARSVAEVRKAKADGKIALPLGMENGSPIEGKLDNLAHFAKRGIRYITLAHSSDNHISDSSYDERHTNGGLTDFGKTVVKEMNKLGVMVDVSHLSDQAIEQAVEVSEVPVIASHSSCRHFTPGWERNISDALIKKVAAKGGVVMINFGSTFIDDELRNAGTKRWEAWKEIEAVKGYADEEKKAAAKKAFYDNNPLGYSTVEKVADHIEHVIKLVGVDHVGFGSDFDGVGDTLPVGLKDVSYYPNLIRVLLERGYSEADLTKIAGENTLRVWQAVEDHAAKASK